MKVAVTGSSGFVGRTLCAALAAAGHESAPIDTADVVVHLAGIADRRATREDLWRVNVHLAVDTAKRAGAIDAHFVFLSSVNVHGDYSDAPLSEESALAPRDAYAESKARAEEALRGIPGLRLAVLRSPLVYGPGVKGNFLALMQAVARGVPLPIASISNRRSFVYVANLADAILASLGRQGIFLLSDGEAVSSPELCRRLGIALQRPARLFRLPLAILRATPALRKLAGSLEVDDSKIRRELNWRPPFSMTEALDATARWYRSTR